MNEELILAEIETKNGTALKQIVMTTFKGKALLQIREKWRKTNQDEWCFGKRVVSFAERQFDSMMLQLKKNKHDVAGVCEMFNIFGGNQ